MVTKTISANIQGGAATKRYLEELAKRIGHGAHVNVGFLAAATYPAAQDEADKDKSYKIRGKNATKRRLKNVNAKHSSGQALHVAQVAFWQNYGTNPTKGPKTPPRPFMSSTVESKSPRWGIALGAAMRKTNYDSAKSLAIMGEVIRGQIRESIVSWTTPGNAEPTKREKGFDKPLINTALMLRSVDYQVITNGDGEEQEA